MSPETLVGTSYRAYRAARDKRKIPKADGPCDLCGLRKAEYRPIVVDHCHTCGIIRGILCVPCNNYMWTADQAAGNFPTLTDEWLCEVNAINAEYGNPPTTLAREIERTIRDLHHFLDRVGAHNMFAYQNRCLCEGRPS
jgi:hypothetical protein